MSPKTPLSWRVGLVAGIVTLTVLAYVASEIFPPRALSAIGVVAFLMMNVVASTNIRQINWRVVGTCLFLQILIALCVIKIPAVYRVLEATGDLVEHFLTFTNGPTETLFGKFNRVPLAIIILPTVIFVASIFSVLFHLRVLQGVVWVCAKGMILLVGKKGASGAETLSTVANVFMGQTEAPLIVAPYVSKMTRSELLAVMIGGMATIAGGVLAIYLQMGADAVALIATSVMAAPCTLYVSKILLPETEEPATRGDLKMAAGDEFTNVIDAAASGASEGMKLAINIIAMLIAFLALVAMCDAFLGWLTVSVMGLQQPYSLKWIFGQLFTPISLLMGVDPKDAPKVGELLGIKLILNEFVAFEEMTKLYKPGTENGISQRSYVLTTYALTGFANIGSIGIQLGGIGCLGKTDDEQKTLRSKLAQLGPRALLGGFLVTLINAAIAGVIL